MRVPRSRAAWVLAVGGYTGTQCERALAGDCTSGGWHVVNVLIRGSCTSSNPNARYGVTAASGGAVYAVGESDISTLVEERTSGHWKIVPRQH